MELNKYQEQAMTTCMESSKNVAYMFYNLLGEVGELVEKVNASLQDVDLSELSDSLGKYGGMAKVIRKEPEKWWTKMSVESVQRAFVSADNTEDMQKEVGDILWQTAGFCHAMGWSMEQIAQQNLDKLASRQQRNVIDGDGDNR